MVSSLPMPVPGPGLKRVPRWRTMISPPVTPSPANTFTPRRLALESRPLRLEPSPFLCAISSDSSGSDAVHPDAGELLAVALAAAVAALGLVLEDADLRAALVDVDHCGHLGRAERVGVELRVAVAGDQQGLELDGGVHVAGQALDQERLPRDHAVLLAAGADDGVAGGIGHGRGLLGGFGDFGGVG